MVPPVLEPTPVTLRDGTLGVVRPPRREDAEREKEALQRGYLELSPESRYRRFLAPVKALSPQMLHRLVDHVDGTDHVALVLDVLEEQRWHPVAVGRYVRDLHRPHQAELAVTVQDAWQGRGIAALLTRALTERALAVGITQFTAVVLAGNTPSLRMLAHAGEITRRDLTYNGVLELVVTLAPPDVS